MADKLVWPDGFIEAINAIPVGGTDTSNATATAADILKGKTAYANGETLVGTMPQVWNIRALVSSGLPTWDGSGEDIIIHAGPVSDADSGIKAFQPTTTSLEIPVSRFKFGDVAMEQVLEGRSFTSADGYHIEGQMPDHTGATVELEDLNPIELDEGYYSGTVVQFNEDAVADLVPENLVEGAYVLGVEGIATAGVPETWTFTMEDGSTVEKEVCISGVTA